jgi:site-specific recombinase XerC
MSRSKHPLQRLSTQLLFESWARLRMQAPGRALSQRSVERYAPIWRVWAAYLVDLDRPWWEASAEDLNHFSSTRPPRSPRQLHPSPVTAARYWRVVQSVYQAVPLMCLTQHLPPLELPLAQAATPLGARSESVDATFVPATMLRLLLQSLDDPLPSEAVDDVRQPWAHVRDRAMLALTLAAAPTVSELASLGRHDVLDANGVTAGAIVIRGARPHALRTVPVMRTAAAWIAAWVELREHLHCHDDVLFPSAKGMRSLSTVSVWRSLATVVREVLLRHGQPMPYHFGPGMLRNSVLLAWLEAQRLDVAEVARRAGFKSPRSLQRLMSQASESVRAAYTAALQSSDAADLLASSAAPLGAGVRDGGPDGRSDE